MPRIRTSSVGDLHESFCAVTLAGQTASAGLSRYRLLYGPTHLLLLGYLEALFGVVIPSNAASFGKPPLLVEAVITPAVVGI